MPIVIPHDDPYKKKCLSCVMVNHDCMMYRGLEEYIKDCPCLTCLVKITCTYDDICDAYSEFMDSLYDDKKLERRINEFEKKYLPYNEQNTVYRR